jgi:hypothetical protein
MSATVEFPKSNVIQFPTAKPQQGYLDIFARWVWQAFV